MGQVVSFSNEESEPFAEGSSALRLSKLRVSVAGHELAYTTLGQGSPIVFLHGNYLSSRMWRHIIPALSKYGRCIAIDLPGFGASDPLKGITGCNTHIQQQRYLFDGLLRALDVDSDVTLVGHGIGSLLACDWAFKNKQKVKAIAYTHGIFADTSRLVGGADLEQLRTPETLAYMLESPDLLEEIISSFFYKPLSQRELSAYSQRLYDDAEAPVTVGNWIRDLPCWGVPEEAQRIVAEYSNWMRASDLPKLWIRSSMKTLEYQNSYDLIAETFPQQRQVNMKGGYVLQEDSPRQFARILKVWLAAQVA